MDQAVANAQLARHRRYRLARQHMLLSLVLEFLGMPPTALFLYYHSLNTSKGLPLSTGVSMKA